MEINWAKWQTITQIPIVIIMAWTTWESHELLTTSQVQTAKASMPLVVFDIVVHKKWVSSSPILKNVGYGPALDIRVSTLKNRGIDLSFDKINGIENGGTALPEFEVYNNTKASVFNLTEDSAIFKRFLSYRGEGFMGRTSMNNLDTIEITYTDLLGNQYRTLQKLDYDIGSNRLYTSIIEYPKVE